MSASALRESYRYGKKPRKYRVGEPIRTVEEFADHCRSGGYVYWFGQRPLHGSFALSQQFLMVLNHLARGNIKRAELTDEYRSWKESNHGE